MADSNDLKLIVAGIVGILIAALCYFTHVLVLLLSAKGLSAVFGWIEYVLLPALTFLIALTANALWLRRYRFKNIKNG